MDIGKGLFDIIGVFIGFICIILLLSIVVTAMVQTIQSVFRLRARNLTRGLEALVRNLFEKNTVQSRQIAISALNASNVCFLGTCKPNRRSKTIPSTSYIVPEDLPAALVEAGLNDASQRGEEIIVGFNKLKNQLEDRFLSKMRLVTFACSILVAGYFQISTPDLLKRLSTDQNLKSQVAAYVQAIEKPQVFLRHEEMAGQALAALKVEFPEAEDKIVAATTREEDNTYVVARLETILADLGDDRSKIIERCNSLLDGMYAEQKQAALNQLGVAVGDMAKFNIDGWPRDWAFYFDGKPQIGNIIGVLVTAVLLSLGAPFWFERLKDALKLKDTLSKGIKLENDPENSGSDQTPVG